MNKMKKQEYLFGIIILFLVTGIVSAIGSGSYNISNPAVVSGGNASSSNYATGVVIGEISGNASSTSYSSCVGFECTVGHSISQSNITLNKGWNLISLDMRQGDNNTDRNISVVAGWNLIGYSSIGKNLSLSSVTFTNSSGSFFTWANAISNNKVQAYLAYYDSSPTSPSERKYKYVATSDLGMDDTMLRSNKGYWIYMNESGNLTLPGVGGSYSNATYDVSKLRFSNGSLELSFSEAKNTTYNWIDDPQYWGLNPPPPNNYDFVVLSSGNMNPWQGYFMYSNVDNLTLIRQN